MGGTFEEGDCLWVRSVPYSSLRAGDVVAIDAERVAIAHRIVGRQTSGFVTQGDSNLRPDGAVLTADRLLGRVVARERQGAICGVAGGSRGRWRAVKRRTARRVALALGILLAPPYRLIRASGLVAAVWRPRIVAARFSRGDRAFTKFIHRGRTVARWDPWEREWRCRKPYDLILAPPPR